MSPSPDLTPIPDSPADVPMTKKQMMEFLKTELLGLLKTEVDEDIDSERFQQIIEIREGNLYWKGDHYHALTLQGDGFNYSSVGVPRGPGSSSDQDDLLEAEIYDTVINHYRSLGKKFVAVVGAAAPSLKCVADNPEDQTSVDNANQGDLGLRVFKSWWDIDRQNRRVALGLWKSGTMFGHVRYVSDGDRFGFGSRVNYEEQDTEILPAGFECTACGTRSVESDLNIPPPPAPPLPLCPACGAPLPPETYRPPVTAPVPVPGETESYPKGQVENTIYDLLSVTIPVDTTDIECATWLRLEYEEHRGKLILRHPEIREKLRKMDEEEGSTSSQSTGVAARQERDSPSAKRYTKKNLITYSRYWLTPAMYELIKDDQKRRFIKKKFKTGLLLVRIHDELIDLQEEKLSDVWEACQPDVSDTLLADSIATDFVPIQDQINDYANIAKETFTRQLPCSIGDPQYIDFEKLNQRAYRPNELWPSKKGASGNLKEAVVNLPKAEMSEQMPVWNDKLLEAGMNLTGILPSIWGGEGPSQTAHEAEMKRNQGLQQLAIPWDELRRFWAKIGLKALKQLAKYGVDDIMAPGDSRAGLGAETVEISKLLIKGYAVVAEESFPQSFGQRADKVMAALQNPVQMQAMNLTHPRNAEVLRETLGFPGLTNPAADMLDYCEHRIRMLLKEPPIPQTTIDPMSGQPIQKMIPSIQPDPVLETDFQTIITIMTAWCMTQAGQTKARTQPQGIANVKAYIKVLQDAAAAQLAAQQAAMNPPPPGAGGGPPGKGGGKGGPPGKGPAGPDPKNPPRPGSAPAPGGAPHPGTPGNMPAPGH